MRFRQRAQARVAELYRSAAWDIAGVIAVPEHPPIPGFVLLKLLGRNGHLVYLARQSSTGRVVWLNVVHSGGDFGQVVADRLRKQAELLATLDHPNIRRPVVVGDAQGHGFYSALEYIEGGSLADRLRSGPLAGPAAAAIARTLALTLDYARGQGMVHEYLQPSSVLLTRDNNPVLDDFRAAGRGEDAGREHLGVVIVGIPNYMAPEQVALALEHDTDLPPSVDVYRIGAVLYAMLTGQPPFQGSTLLETLEQVRTQQPLPLRRWQPGVPPDLEVICLKCLEKQPARRYRCLGDLANDLTRFLKKRSVLPDPAGPVPRPAWHWWNWLRHLARRKGTPEA
jgi:serine/threonine protein kinase